MARGNRSQEQSKRPQGILFVSYDDIVCSEGYIVPDLLDAANPTYFRLFRALLEKTDMLVYIIDIESGVLMDVSAAVLRLGGFRRQDVVGRDVRTFRVSYPIQTQNEWRTFVEKASDPGGFLITLDSGKANGESFRADLHVIAGEFDGQRYLVAAGQLQDRGDRSYGHLERQNVWQAALLAITNDPGVMQGEADWACQLVAEKAAEALPSAGAAVWLRDADSTTMMRAKGVAGEWKLPQDCCLDLSDYPSLAGPTDLFSLPGGRLPFAALEGVRACLVAPIVVNGSLRGAVTLLHRARRIWSVEELAFAGMVADQAATALLRAEYRKAQGAIRDSEERYRKFVENASEAIWRIDFSRPIAVSLDVEEQLRLIASTGVFAGGNAAAARLAGVADVAEMFRLPLMKLFGGSEKENAETIRKLVQNTYRVQDLLSFHQNEQGRGRWLLYNIEGIVEQGCLVRLWVSSRDATQRKRAEDLLTNLARTRTGPDLFRTLAAHIAQSLGAYEVDVVAFRPNAEASEVLARIVEGVFVTKLPDWMGTGEFCVSTPERVCKPLLDSNGQTIGVLAALVRSPADDTAILDSALEAFAARAAAELERDRYEEDLERSRQRYLSFVEFSSELIWCVDLKVPMPLTLSEDEQVEHIVRHGYWSECNQLMAETFGFRSAAELVGRSLQATYVRDIARRRKEIEALVKGGGSIHDQETFDPQPDGSTRWFSRSVIGIRENGFMVRFWGVSRETTANKVMELQIRALSARRREMLEEERARISREIHDDLGQQLSGLKMYIASLAQGQGAVRESALDEAVKLVDTAISSTRRIAADLRPPVLDHFGLAAAIECHVQDLTRTTGLGFDCDIQENVNPSPGLALAIFRILQESLNNVIRHADAKKVMVTLMQDESDLVLNVSDDGRGIVRAEVSGQRPGGLGLAGMRERASAFGGDLLVVSRAGKGTSVEARFPVVRTLEKRASA